MKTFFSCAMLFVLSLFCSAQTIITDTILVNQSKVSILTMDGEILQMNLADEISLIDEPLFLNGKSIINFKAEEAFKNFPEVNIISSNGNYYSV